MRTLRDAVIVSAVGLWLARELVNIARRAVFQRTYGPGRAVHPAFRVLDDLHVAIGG